MAIAKVLTTRKVDSIEFRKIKDFGDMTALYPDDRVIVTGSMSDGTNSANRPHGDPESNVTKNVTVASFGRFFSEFNVNAQWFLPVLNGSTIDWEWASEAPSHIDSINLLTAIPVATKTSNGLMSAEDKVRLGNATAYELPVATKTTLGGVKIDDKSIFINENGQLYAKSAASLNVQKFTLKATGWNDSNLQTVKCTIDTTKLNTIVVDPGSVEIWSNCGVLAINENSEGVTFKCSLQPRTDLDFAISEMGISSNVIGG